MLLCDWLIIILFYFQTTRTLGMPTFLQLLRYWSLLASLAIIFSVYFIFINTPVEDHYDGNQYRINIKKIVAYSLSKQIEMESEEYFCKGTYRIKKEELNPNIIKSHMIEEENIWIPIPKTNLYVSSVNLDRRLDPYHYIRIIGLVKGKNYDKTV